MNEVVTALKEARGLVSAGWTQRAFCNEQGVCTVGAVNRSRTALDRRSEFKDELFALLGKAAGIDKDYLIIWNDAPDRTQAEVLALFDKAIELAGASSRLSGSTTESARVGEGE